MSALLMAHAEVSITMDANGQPEPLAGELVSSNYVYVLGVMAVGRGFAPDEDRIGAPVRAAISTRSSTGTYVGLTMTTRPEATNPNSA